MFFCHENDHWNKDCPKLKKKDKGKFMFDACVIEHGILVIPIMFCWSSNYC